MPLSPSRLVRRIHESPLRIVMATTGGGSSALEELLAVPGASRTVLEGVVPYSAAALRSLLGATPENYCSPETARAMAMAAFHRALRFAGDEGEASQSAGKGGRLSGIACTASLATDRPKKGPHRAHLAAQTADVTITQSIEFEKGRRSRSGEEKLLGRLVLNLLAEIAELSERLPTSLTPGETLETSQTTARPEWAQLLLGELPAVRQGPDVALATERRAIFPGAFNPRHEAHRQIADVALRRLGGADKTSTGKMSVEHEIAIINVDKPPLDFTEIERRLGQFGPEETLWLTSAPRFEQKADLFPNVTFLVGADTIVRIGDPRYYGGDPAARDRAVAHIGDRQCRFLVFGRLVGGSFRDLSQLDLPGPLAKLCDEIPAAEFREDVSSTELRREGDL